MAKPEKPKKSRSNVVPMAPEVAGNVAVEEKPPETPFDETAPPKVAAPPPTRRNPSFFERANAIPKADWGTRAFIYVYCLEPICNLKMGGETKYLVRLSEPIADEQALMIDYGSGKYRLQLVNRKGGGDKSDAIDTKEIEIYNPKYPPKIPRAVWMNDPRNERWAALLPKEEPPQPQTGLGTLTDAFKTFGEIRRDLKEEMAPPVSTTPAAPVSDPIDAGLRIAQMMMTMKADNPMVEIMRDQLRLSNESAEKARDREAALQKELRDSMRKPDQQGEKFGPKQWLAELKDFMPGLKELMPQVTEAARAGRTNWLDVFRDVAPVALDYVGKIGLAYASRMPMPGPPLNGNGHPPQQIAGPPQANGQPAQPQQAQPQQQVPKFVQFLSQPFVFDGFRRYFDGYKNGTGQTGGDFSQWVFDGGGAEPLKDARGMGSLNIMALLKQSPAWLFFQSDEAKLVEFVDQALAWTPPVEDTDDDDDEAVDLTQKGV